MDSAYLLEVLSLGLRWLHLIVGIAWIGSSFYFVWLDNSIRPPTDPALKEKGVLGELWAMHGGGFYNPTKYAVAPKELPAGKLHWFFWPSYSTFITGFFLITVLYYFQASVYMVDPAKWNLPPVIVVHIGLGTLVVGWIVYHLLADWLIDRSQIAFAIAYTLFVALMSFVLNSVLSGRAAYLHIGAMIATTMSANVFFVIIPAQHVIVGAMKKGEAPDPKYGKRAKQRSVHNNYLTLPVLFAMISNHYAFTYNHKHAWIVLMLIMVGSVYVRHFFNLRHHEIIRWRFPIIGFTLILAALIWTMPRSSTASSVPLLNRPVPIEEVQAVVATRCYQCHVDKPTLVASPGAGVVLDSPEKLRAQAARIFTQVAQTRAMPQGNATGMTEDERSIVATWARSEKEKR